MDAKEVTLNEARAIIDSGDQRGLFYYVNANGAFVGVDTRGIKPVVRVCGKKKWLEKWMKERV